MRGKSIRVGEALEALLGRRGSRKAAASIQARVDAAWDKVAGEEISCHTKGFGVRGGSLLVHVDNHAWATQLAYMAEDLRTQLNQELGQEAVREIRFNVTRTVGDDHKRRGQEGEAKRRYGGKAVEPVPLTREERGRIEREASGIENDRLRQAAIRARSKALEWKKGTETANARQGPPEDA